VIDFGLGAGIVVSQADLQDLQEAAEFGSPYFKVFMPSEPPVDTALLWQAVKAAAHTGLRLAIHAEETACLESEVDWKDPLGFAKSRPVVAEVSAAAQVLEMARAAGAPLHICHVSAGRTCELIDQYRGWGVDVTAETTPHYLIFDESEFIRQGARVKTTPPLRHPQDVEALWQALAEGIIDAVVSDHYLGMLPTTGRPEPGLRESEAGIAGLEFSMPLLFDVGVSKGRISLERFVECTSLNPARILGYSHRKGCIAPGMDADLVILDPQVVWTAAVVGPFSRAAWSPYTGRAIQGFIRRTLVRGETVWDSETICVRGGSGQFVESHPSTKSSKNNLGKGIKNVS
jgi:dihydroorotase-like cyclic amidohydrolase